MQNQLTVQDIYVYPIKSLGGIRLDEAWVEERGFQFDRRWMLVNSEGGFVSQREFPEMAILQVLIAQDSLVVFDKRNRSSQIRIPINQEMADPITVRVWDDEVEAVKVGDEFDRWFSEKLGVKVSLVKMPSTTRRKVDPKYAKNGESVSFADGMPYLLIGQSSLNDLNARLSEHVPMDRFRPNIVFRGGAPFAEDKINFMKIGNLEFSLIKPCARCVLTTVDQDTGKKGKEPLKTLASFRTKDNKVLFGQNMVALSNGKIKIGDSVEFMG
ncbi:MOSC domain-containing protein [Algoriphagus pacificus]|uniref:MOSC domain-containing protein n=1 Tax=Algoriphagus pacificus TaxID=2811234 RepID=UPI001F1C4A21|nr:MOSC N-terminal beta barrel domain-containing protein [Algoriphagus pacificus]